jgi:hypothetical protein
LQANHGFHDVTHRLEFFGTFARFFNKATVAQTL